MRFIIAFCFCLFSLSSIAVIQCRPLTNGIQYFDTEKNIFATKYDDETYLAYMPYRNAAGTDLVYVYDKKESEDLFMHFKDRCSDKMEVETTANMSK